MTLDAAAEQAAGLGMAILYEDFLRHVREESISSVKRRGPGRKRGADASALALHRQCPACESADRVAANYLALLGTEVPETDVGRAARREGRGLCIPHLVAGLRLMPDAASADRLIDVYLRGEAELRAELREYIRKQDYRYTNEPPGREVGAWRRAVWRMVGSPVPRRQPQRGRDT
jgi:hypothetical protein